MRIVTPVARMVLWWRAGWPTARRSLWNIRIRCSHRMKFHTCQGLLQRSAPRLARARWRAHRVQARQQLLAQLQRRRSRSGIAKKLAMARPEISAIATRVKRELVDIAKVAGNAVQDTALDETQDEAPDVHPVFGKVMKRKADACIVIYTSAWDKAQIMCCTENQVEHTHYLSTIDVCVKVLKAMEPKLQVTYSEAVAADAPLLASMRGIAKQFRANILNASQAVSQTASQSAPYG